MRLPDGGIQAQAVADSTGRIHVVYFKGDAAHGDLFYTRLAPNGTFTSAIRVNSQPGSAIATGTMRGGHLAVGRRGRVHVAWHGSDRALPRAQGNETPVLYTYLNDVGTAFQSERNVVQKRVVGLDGGTVAADSNGNVYVAWHAFEPGLDGEADRRVWVTRSSNGGQSFALEVEASDGSTGACGCCGVGALADRGESLYLLYRSATQLVHRDTYLLTSRDKGATFAGNKLQEWNIGACPMSTFSLADAPSGVLAAWETNGEVQWLRVDSKSSQRSPVIAAPGPSSNRKHPAIAGNARGETLLVWTEGTGWNRGGGLAWQLFDSKNQPVGDVARAPGVAAWNLSTVVARDNGFVIIY